MSAVTSNWTKLLCEPGIPSQFPPADTYRAACIGAVMLLYEAKDAAALADAVRHAAAPESKARSLWALESLTRTDEPVRNTAIHLLHELAIIDGNQNASEFLRRSNLQDQDPGWNSARMLLFGQKHQLQKEDPGPEKLSELFLNEAEPFRLRLLSHGEKVLPHWVLLMRFLDVPSPENRARLIENYQSFSPDERKLLRYCAASENTSLSSITADLLLQYEDETLQKLCTEHKLKPSDSSQEALFYFLSGQWEHYYASDSDYRRIRIAYEKKDPALQRRLIAVSRDSGNNAWLRDISNSSENIPHSGTLSDQRLLTNSLIEQKQWDRLWETLPSLPLLCMPAAVNVLQHVGFQPAQPDEKAFFADLSAKIKACEELSPVPVLERHCENNGSAVMLCGGGNYVAAVFTDRRIMVWDKRSSGSEPIRITSNHLNFRKAIIDCEGKYLCADCGNDGITVFSLPGGQAVKNIPLSGSLLSGLFLQPDARRLITVGQNGKGIVYSFPGGAELFRFDIGLKDCSRTAYDPQSNRVLGMTPDGTTMAYNINDRQLVTGVNLGNDVLSVQEQFSHDRLSIIEKGEFFSLINLLSGKPIHDRLSLGNNTARRCCALFDGDLFALGTLDGKISIFDPVAQNFPVQLTFGSKTAVTGLWYDEQDTALYGCNAAGTVRSWDLRLFHEMTRTLALTQLPGFNRIDEFVKKYPEPGVKAAADWIKTIIIWRRRFDIELEFD